MKNILFLAVLFTANSVVKAQQGARRTVEERVQIAHQKLDSAFKLDNAKLTEADSVFAAFYRSANKTREEMMSGGQTDFQAMREKMQPAMDERDKKLQGILTEDQYKTWKDQIEPSLRPRRQQ